uniref:Uncharacterized protein n=1 Tax=Xenopus tropicalis TaxID=8364 RepID=A0A1B8Y397_XENTR
MGDTEYETVKSMEAEHLLLWPLGIITLRAGATYTVSPPQAGSARTRPDEEFLAPAGSREDGSALSASVGTPCV